MIAVTNHCDAAHRFRKRSLEKIDGLLEALSHISAERKPVETEMRML